MSLLTGDSWCVLVFGRPNWALEAGRTRVGGRNGTIQMNPLNPILSPNDVQRCTKTARSTNLRRNRHSQREESDSLACIALTMLAISCNRCLAKSNKDAYLRFSC